MKVFYIVFGIIDIIVGILIFKRNNALGVFNLMNGTYYFTKGLYDKED